MPDTYKVMKDTTFVSTFALALTHPHLQGIYLKFRGSGGLITDILFAFAPSTAPIPPDTLCMYENIVMDSPSQYAHLSPSRTVLL